MNRLIINKICIVDYKNKVANEFEFSEGANLVISEKNGQGKSSLVKSIYYGLGCNLDTFPKNWNPQKYIIQLYVTINDKEFIIKRHNNIISIRGRKESFVFNSLRDYSEWLQVKLGMSLKLLSSKNKLDFAYIDAILSPFYIDQDKGWHGTLYKGAFKGLGQYKSAVFPKDLIDYYLGISNENINYLKSIKEDLNTQKKLLKERINQIQGVYNSYQEENGVIDSSPKNIDELKQELEEYIEKTNEISIEIQKVTKHIERLKLNLDIKRQDKNELELILKGTEERFENIHHECSYCHSILTREQSLTRLELEDNRLTINSFKESIVAEISKLENSLSKKQSDLSELRDKINSYRIQTAKIKGVKDIKDYVSQSVLAELEKLQFKELNDKKSLDKEILQIEKEIKSLKRELNTRVKNLENFYENLKNEISFLIETDGLVDRKFRDYKSIQGSGTSLNKDLLAIYLIYMNLIEDNSNFKLPFAIDSFVKNEYDSSSYERMFSAISSYFLTLETQTFFSVIRENIDKITGNYYEIKVESPLLKEDKYEEVSRDIIEYDN